jgi:O-antigen/teichoic acid export membrane protein
VTTPPPSPAVTEHHVARGVGTVLLARLGAVVEIVAQPLYVLMFGLAGYGLYAVLWAAVNLAENIFDLGMTSALQRTVPQAASAAEEVTALRTALLWGVTPCLAVAALASLMADPLGALINVAVADTDRVAPAIRLFAWALPLWAFVEIATSALRAKALFGPEIRLRIFWEQIIRLGLATLLWAMGWGVTGLFVAHLASLAITAALTLRLVARHYALSPKPQPPSPLMSSEVETPSVRADGVSTSLDMSGEVYPEPFEGLDMSGNKKIARQTLLAGLSILPANMIARLFGDAPALILNALLPGAAGASAAALFVIARKLSSIVQLVRTAFVYVLAPLASSAEREYRAQVAAIYSYATRLILVVALPLSVVLAAGSAPLLSLFGPQAGAAVAAVAILFIARAIEAVLGIAVPVFQVVGGFRHQLTGSVIGLMVAAAAAWPLANALGPLTGITAATAIGFVIAAAIPMVQLAQHEGLHPFGPTLAIAATRAGLIGAAALAASLALATLPSGLAVPAIIALALGAIWCALRFALPLSDRESLGGVGRRLRLI